MQALRVLLLPGLLLAAAARPAPESTPVLKDGFDDGGFTNGADPLDASWLVTQEDLPRLEMRDGPPGAGKVLATASARGWSKLAAPLGAPFGLRGPGTFARLSFTFRLATPEALEKARGTAGQDMFRFGLYDAGGRISAPLWQHRDGEADGFGGCLPLSPPDNAAKPSANLFAEDNQAAGRHGILGGPVPEGLVSLGRSRGWPGITDDRPHRVVLLLREEPGDKAVLSLSVDGVPLVEARDVPLKDRPRAFDIAAFGTGPIGYDFELDDVLVEVVPD